jgi:AraC-like DNA-binding protein
LYFTYLVTKFYTPHFLLQDFVQCIMVIHAEFDPLLPPVIAPYPPSPQNSLFFYINDPIQVRIDSKDVSNSFVLQPRAVIVGPQITPVSLNIDRNHKAVRVGFQPGGLHRLLGISMSEMVDNSYHAADVFGNDIDRLNNQLQEAHDFDDIKNLIESFLIKRASRLKDALPFDQAMLALMRSKGNLTVEKMASLACLSFRQFERVSKERIGVSPKFFARLVRFSAAYRIYEHSPHRSWTDIAYEAGYFDQVHFIRDFKEFAGVTPRTLEKLLEQVPVRLQAELRL